MSRFKLRPFQERVVLDAARYAAHYGTERAGGVLVACGGGKTVIMGALAWLWRRAKVGKAGLEFRTSEKPAKILIISPAEELVKKDLETIWACNPDLGRGDIAIEQAGKYAHADAKIVSASLKSLTAARFKALCETVGGFDLCFLDEGHVAPQWTSWLREGLARQGCPIIVLSATFDRLDGFGVVPVLADDVVACVETSEIEEMGYLTRATVLRVDSVLMAKGIELGDGEQVALKGRTVNQRISTPEAIAATARLLVETEEIQGKSMLVACASVAHAEQLAEAVNLLKEGAARAVSHRTSGRDVLLEEWQRGDWEIACVYEVWTTGMDFPGLEVVVFARDTASRVVYTQFRGRGARLSEGKDTFYVVDLVGVTRRHSVDHPAEWVERYITRQADPLPTLIEPRQWREMRWEEAVNASGRFGSVQNEEGGEVSEEQEQDAREWADMASLLQQVQGWGLELADTQLDEETMRRRRDLVRVTLEQRQALLGAGLSEVPPWLPAGVVDSLLKGIEYRKHAGLCTLGQALRLMRASLSPMASREAASAAIRVLDSQAQQRRNMVRSGAKARVEGFDWRQVDERFHEQLQYFGTHALKLPGSIVRRLDAEAGR